MAQGLCDLDVETFAAGLGIGGLGVGVWGLGFGDWGFEVGGLGVGS